MKYSVPNMEFTTSCIVWIMQKDLIMLHCNQQVYYPANIDRTMNFLLRPSQQSASVDQPTLNVSDGDSVQMSKSMTLEGLIAEDSFPRYYSADDSAIETDGTRTDHVSIPGPRNDAPAIEKHTDISEEEGWITIPYGESHLVYTLCLVWTT